MQSIVMEEARRARAVKRSHVLFAPLLVYGMLGGVYIGSHVSWSWFAWHPVLMLISCISMAANGVLMKKKGGSRNTSMHGCLMAAASATMLCGWYVIHTNKKIEGKPHFTSWHSRFGAVSALGMLLLACTGMAWLFPQWGYRLKSASTRRWHRRSARIVLLLAFATCISGALNLFHVSLFSAPGASFASSIVCIAYFSLVENAARV